ncbi:cold shock domain-containing protein [Nakamurella flavida]|uniref:Cold shock domain-containing protein n=1 Tax=Nakamurella flavida TaxID=363630 RepID=A0A938YE73_9ACTN|nr:cold shock domain-containing protein [Nakamurella flavida]MDP9777226.1 CspA family cold shock protein [Nakamurella flavida]
MARGTVKFLKTEKGWGAISSPELPPGCDAFVHFSEIQARGYRELHAGDRVEFDHHPARQDSFLFVATRVRRPGPGPAPTLRRDGQRVIAVPNGTPDTPLTPRRGQRPAE